MNVRLPISMGIVAAVFWLSSPIFLSQYPAKNLSDGESSTYRSPSPNSSSSESRRSPGPELMGGNFNRNQASSSLDNPDINDAVSNHPPLQPAPRTGYIPTVEFFTRTQANPPVKFDLVVPKFVAGGPCKRNSEDLERSFQETLSRNLQSVNSFVPDSLGIVDLNFYMQFRGKYYQLSLEPISETLESYQLTLIQSSSPDFTANTERLAFGRLDPLQRYPSAGEALAELQKLIGEYTSQGARWGTRTALLTNKVVKSPLPTNAPLTNASPTFRIEMHNGHVHGFMNHQQECHLNKDERLDCRCW
ncbi:MAG: hypothetical protein ACO3A4_01225 [Silvanigrellaceae bacterium]